MRLTDTQGHQATVRGIALRPGAAQATGTWMYRTGGGQPPVYPDGHADRYARRPPNGYAAGDPGRYADSHADRYASGRA